MAKKTKVTNLSLEERLEQALIPNWDEPYKLPSNWCWIKLSAVCSLENGEKSSEKDLVYLDAKTLRGTAEPQTRDRGIIVNKNQKVILVDGENSGEVFVVPYRGYMCSTFKIINIADNADEIYIRYFIDQNREKLRKNKIGSAIPHLNKDLLFNLELPFPPLNEQRRIVAHIESLFTKLDEAKEKAQEVVDGFETRKAAILHKAFTGELTAKWRYENGITKELWLLRRINQVCKARAGYAFESKKFTDSGYQVIRMGNLYGGNLDLNRNPVFVSANDVDNSILKRALINDGDILITLTGTKYKRDYGYAVCIRNPNNYLVNQRILCLTPDHNEVTTDFLLFYLQSDLFRDLFFSNETGGVNQGNVSSKFVENIQINVPSYEEQEEIGRVLRNALDKEYKAKDAAETVMGQIDTIKQAILAHAFRGELGTNDPTDESAVELLKRII